jgi:hypothetical protein
LLLCLQLFYVLTQPATEHWNIVSLTFLILFGALAVWWLRWLARQSVGRCTA